MRDKRTSMIANPTFLSSQEWHLKLISIAAKTQLYGSKTQTQTDLLIIFSFANFDKAEFIRPTN